MTMSCNPDIVMRLQVPFSTDKMVAAQVSDEAHCFKQSRIKSRPAGDNLTEGVNTLAVVPNERCAFNIKIPTINVNAVARDMLLAQSLHSSLHLILINLINPSRHHIISTMHLRPLSGNLRISIRTIVICKGTSLMFKTFMKF